MVPRFTVMFAMLLIEPFVAVIVPVPGIVWAVNKPLLSTEPTSVLQMKSMPGMTLLNMSWAVAVNNWLSPTVIDNGSGVIVI